ncbi:hypothetical protein ACNKHM_13585 [Shigella sonnei]
MICFTLLFFILMIEITGLIAY